MPYREKTAWLSLMAMALTFGPYFTLSGMGYLPETALPNWNQLGLYAKTALSQVALLGIGHLYLRHQSPVEARIPPDERDQNIMLRARTLAYYMLMAGMIFVGVVMPFTKSGWQITNAALFMIIVAEVVYYSGVVFCYRKSA